MIADIGVSSDDRGHMGPSSAYVANAKSSLEENGHRFQYTMPGILQFLQAEWSRFEMDRSQWLVERAELQARIAFLQAERKGQENLKQDLVRRIKMLEFALKQERARYHKLKHGLEPSPTDAKEPGSAQEAPTAVENMSADQGMRQGRQLLRQYLQEIGYTDIILNAEPSRVQSLLGAAGRPPDSGTAAAALLRGMPATTAGSAAHAATAVNGLTGTEGDCGLGSGGDDRASDEDEADGDDGATQRQILTALADSAGSSNGGGSAEDDDDSDTDEALAEFDFLVSESYGAEGRTAGDGAAEWTRSSLAADAESGGSAAGDWGGAADQRLLIRLKEEYRRDRRGRKGFGSGSGTAAAAGGSLGAGSAMPRSLAHLDGSGGQDGGPQQQHQQPPPPALSVLHAMMSSLATGGVVGEDDITSEDETNAFAAVDQRQPTSVSGRPPFAAGAQPSAPDASTRAVDDIFDTVGTSPATLGDLADISVVNESSSFEATESLDVDGLKRTWVPKYTLRSHFDGVRAVSFHPVEPVLLTASEDHTLKLWNLQKTVPSKKTAAFDVEPVYTLRGHMGPVLCLATSGSGEQCYSGGLDATIRCWTIPSAIVDPYDSFDSSVLQQTLAAHSDAVWGLAVHSARMQLLSCSADGTVRLWSPGEGRKQASPLLHTYLAPAADDGAPTCVDFLANEPNQMVAAYTSGNSYVYDLETGKAVVRLESKASGGARQINRIVNHPTLPLTIAAQENCQITFFDTVSGQLTHSMVAHLDAVTTLAVDPNGLYLLSGSHDCSVRLWSLETRTCVQEITTHRKKWDEAIFDVAFHPSKPYIASAGADGLAKVYV